MEFFLSELKSGLDLKKPSGKRRYLDGAIEYLPKVANVAERGHYVSIIAGDIGLAPEALYEALKLPREKAGSVLDRKVNAKGARLLELTVLKVIISRPELFSPAVEEAVAAFTDPALKEAGLALVARLKQGGAPDSAFTEEAGQGDEGGGAVLARLALSDDEGFIEAPERMLEDCLKRVLNKGKIKEATRGVIKRLAEAGLTEAAVEMEKRIEGGKGGRGGAKK